MTDHTHPPADVSMPNTITAWPDFGPESVTGKWSANTYDDARAVEYTRSDIGKTTIPQAVRVKPLVWHPKHGCDATGLGIHYCMSETTPGLFSLYSPFHTKEDMPKSKIQAIAQADYDARIMAAIEPAPDPRDQVIARLQADLTESNRRRDGWKEKAQGYDALAAAVRAKIGTDNRVSMSRVVLTGALYEAENRVKQRDAEIAQLVEAAKRMVEGVIVECNFDNDHSPDFGRRYLELRAAVAAAKAVM